MARTVTLADLRSRTLIRAGFPINTQKIDTSAGGWLDDELNQSAAAFWDKILLAWGDDYGSERDTLTTTAGVDTVNLPSDFYRLIGLDWYTGGVYRDMLPFAWADRNRFQNLAWSDGAYPRYMLSGNRLLLVPTPTSVETLRITYVPTLTTIDSTHTLDGVHGWDEYVVLDAAVKCRESCRMEPGTLLSDRAACEARIIAMAPRRDIRETPKLVRRRGRAWMRRYL